MPEQAPREQAPEEHMSESKDRVPGRPPQEHSTTDVETVRAHLTETVWLVVEAFGGRRDCLACAKVVRHMDRRELGSVCVTHGRKP